VRLPRSDLKKGRENLSRKEVTLSSCPQIFPSTHRKASTLPQGKKEERARTTAHSHVVSPLLPSSSVRKEGETRDFPPAGPFGPKREKRGKEEEGPAPIRKRRSFLFPRGRNLENIPLQLLVLQKRGERRGKGKTVRLGTAVFASWKRF